MYKMYKDFKKSDSLDTGFAAGSSLLWMFSGIVLGLLVGLGMYFFSNDRLPSVSMIDSLEEKIQKAQTNTNQANGLNKTSASASVGRTAKTLEKANGGDEERRNKFSYYAVLPNLNVPVGEAKPIKTGSSTEDVFISDNPNTDATAQKLALVEPVIEAPAQEVSIGDYMLQVASFRKQSMADKTRGRLNNKGIDAYVQKKKIKGRYWYRVVAGPVDQSSVDTWKNTAEKLGHKPLVISIR